MILFVFLTLQLNFVIPINFQIPKIIIMLERLLAPGVNFLRQNLSLPICIQTRGYLKNYTEKPTAVRPRAGWKHQNK